MLNRTKISVTLVWTTIIYLMARKSVRNPRNLVFLFLSFVYWILDKIQEMCKHTCDSFNVICLFTQTLYTFILRKVREHNLFLIYCCTLQGNVKIARKIPFLGKLMPTYLIMVWKFSKKIIVRFWDFSVLCIFVTKSEKNSYYMSL